MRVVTYDGQGGVVNDEGTPEVQKKTVYTKVDFIDKMPKAIRQEIRAEEKAGTPDVLDWTFIVNAMVDVDLNDIPTGFVEGLDAMVLNPNITITQGQVDNFLER